VREPDVIISRSQVVNLGYNLRARLEAVARAEGLDVTSASRRVLTAWVEAREREGQNGFDPTGGHDEPSHLRDHRYLGRAAAASAL